MQDESEWLKGLADKVATRIADLKKKFEDSSIAEHLRNFPTDSNETAWGSVRRALVKERAGFFSRAMSEVITDDVARRGEAVYFKVSRILSARSAAKSRGKKKSWPSKKTIQTKTIQPTIPLDPFAAMLEEVDEKCAPRVRLAFETGRLRGKRRGRVF